MTNLDSGYVTRREVEVWRLIADGHTDESAGHQLGMSIHTVKTHLRHLAYRFGLVDCGGLRARLTRLWIEGGAHAKIQLSDSDRRLAAMIWQGRSNPEMALEFGINGCALSSRIRQLCKRTRSRDRVQLALKIERKQIGLLSSDLETARERMAA